MPPENSGFTRSFIDIPPAPNFFRMNPAPKGVGKQDPSKPAPISSSPKASHPDQNIRQLTSQSSTVALNEPARSASDEFKLLNRSTNGLNPSSPTTPATSSWIDANVDSPSFMEDILTLESPPPKGHVLQGYRNSKLDVLPLAPKTMSAFQFAPITTAKDSLEASFGNSSFAELPSLTDDDDSLLIKKVESLQSVQKSSPKSAANTSTTLAISQDRAENRNASRSPVLVKFPTNIQSYTGTPTVLPKAPPTSTDRPLDPILGALNSLQHEKSRVEQELASSLDLLSSTKDELSHAKASLHSLKERFQRLNETIAKIGMDRESLRHGMDEVVTRIDGVKLALVELKSDVYVGRREIESTRQLDTELALRLHELDKGLHSSMFIKSMTCEMLEDKLDEKSGLLVEERSKVLSLEDKVQKLTSLNESLTERYNEDQAIAFKTIEDRISRYASAFARIQTYEF
ncbi:hypothetical protein V1517DRAFT_358762 [Lipomyces orientalis]|uniref:Uncharacterized protein n=1 Tax=Lipomyces orientalis TaxID=1233043 RepID=A0ACC3TZ79_9ASCO